MIVPMLLIIYNSCVSVPPHKIAFDIVPEKNKICQIVDKRGKRLTKPICFEINHKEKNGSYKFRQYGSYSCISNQAIREVLIRKELELEAQENQAAK